MKEDRKITFIAETITDIGKVIFAVGLASYFFEKLPIFWRITGIILSLIFIFFGVIIYPEGGDK